MKDIFKTYRPEGFKTINPYLFAKNPEVLIAFLKAAFYAEERNRTVNDQNGEILNSILQIGDSCFMISQARGVFEGMRTSFYLFVDDVDTVYKNALAHGGVSVLEPADMEYEDRQGGIEDPAGNYWWISKRLTHKNYED